jgi:hypothetical protein
MRIKTLMKQFDCSSYKLYVGARLCFRSAGWPGHLIAKGRGRSLLILAKAFNGLVTNTNALEYIWNGMTDSGFAKFAERSHLFSMEKNFTSGGNFSLIFIAQVRTVLEPDLQLALAGLNQLILHEGMERAMSGCCHNQVREGKQKIRRLDIAAAQMTRLKPPAEIQH